MPNSYVNPNAQWQATGNPASFNPTVNQLQALQQQTNSNTIDQQILANQAAAAKVGITIPGVGDRSTPAQTSTAPTLQNTSDQYLQSYLDSMKASPQEGQYQSQLDALTSQEAGINASKALGIQGVGEQPIATPFITGEQAAITNRAATQIGALSAQAVPLQAQLARAQGLRQAAMDVSKERLSYAQEQDKAANAWAQNQYNEQQSAARATQAQKASSALETQRLTANAKLAAGDALVGANGNLLYTNPKTYAPPRTSSTSGTAKGTTGSATFVENSLGKVNLSYAKAIASVPNGQIGVIDNTTGQFGFINPKDYSASKYTKI